MLAVVLGLCIGFQYEKPASAKIKPKLEVARTDVGPESVIVDASPEQRNSQNESTERPSDNFESAETPVQEETIDNIAEAQGESLANPNSDDIPTFDEALDMEVVTVGSPQNDIRRRVSSRLSLKSDELPDYENYESHPVISGIEKF